MSARLDATGLALPGRLHPTDLHVEHTGLVCLIGPNGSGKTSLLHALAGIGDAEGKVRINGEDPERLPPARRKRLLAYLPASRDAAWPVTARDLVALGGAPDPALAALELESFADRRLDRLSTGERSRVLLARALAQRPALLLLDEPAANLDPAWQLRLMQLLRDTAKERLVIVAMHDLDLAGDHADRLILMDRGRIAADGVPQAVLDGPEVEEVFGVRRADYGRWRLVNPRAGPRSSR